MVRNFNLSPALSRQDVVPSIVLVVQHLASHEGSHFRIIVNFLKLHAINVLVIVQVYNVEARTSLILLSQLVVVLLIGDFVVLELIMPINEVVALLLTLQALFSQVVDFLLLLVELVLANEVLGGVETLLEACVVVEVVGGIGVRAKNLCTINILIEPSRSLLKPSLLKKFSILRQLHSSRLHCKRGRWWQESSCLRLLRRWY